MLKPSIASKLDAMSGYLLLAIAIVLSDRSTPTIKWQRWCSMAVVTPEEEANAHTLKQDAVSTPGCTTPARCRK